jgi:putative membrane protein
MCNGSNGYYNMVGYGNHFSIFGVLLGLLALFLIIYGIVELIRYSMGGHNHDHDHHHGPPHEHGPERPDEFYRYKATQDSSAMTILKERYAKGEITREQFEEMRRNLT